MSHPRGIGQRNDSLLVELASAAMVDMICCRANEVAVDLVVNCTNVVHTDISNIVLLTASLTDVTTACSGCAGRCDWGCANGGDHGQQAGDEGSELHCGLIFR